MASKTLIGNWVEEVRVFAAFSPRVDYWKQRQCAGLEEGNRCADGTLSTGLHRSGHRGILAASTRMETSSTTHDSYASPQPFTVRTTGIYFDNPMYSLKLTHTQAAEKPRFVMQRTSW